MQNEEALRERLAKVKRLCREGATPGERAAARAAVERIMVSLAALGVADEPIKRRSRKSSGGAKRARKPSAPTGPELFAMDFDVEGAVAFERNLIVAIARYFGFVVYGVRQQRLIPLSQACLNVVFWAD
jgi:hypothetical protein